MNKRNSGESLVRPHITQPIPTEGLTFEQLEANRDYWFDRWEVAYKGLEAEIARNTPMESLLRGQRDLQRARAEKAEEFANMETARALANFQSYERVKAKYSELVTAAKFALLFHDEPCRADHHGLCQTHNLEPVHLCWVPALRKALTGGSAA